MPTRSDRVRTLGEAAEPIPPPKEVWGAKIRVTPGNRRFSLTRTEFCTPHANFGTPQPDGPQPNPILVDKNGSCRAASVALASQATLPHLACVSA
jgi:hypothetical protein